MVNFIELSQLTSNEKIKFVTDLENNDNKFTETTIRGINAKYITQTKRQLWQALGHEYIEPELLDYIDSIEQDEVFYDIGSSNGIFSIYASLKGLRVFAFEPEIQNLALLEMNNFLNHKKYKHKAIVFNIAISDKNKIGSIYINKYEPGAHVKILGKAEKKEKIKEEEISLFEVEYIQNVLEFRLDSFVRINKLPKPNHIKIDIDGSELKAINGSRDILKSDELKSIFIELEENDESSKIIKEKLKNYGFAEKSKKQVQNYKNLYNYVFRKK